MEAVQNLLNTGSLTQKEPSFYDELEEELCGFCPKLTYQQRLMGAAACFGLGFFLSFGSLFRIMELLKGDPAPFALTYTLGNIVAICSSCFISGPQAQAKKMFKQHRVLATLVYLLSIGLTFFVAFAPNVPARFFLLVLCIVFQFCALAYYLLSYIPYGREALIGCCKRGCGVCDEV